MHVCKHEHGIIYYSRNTVIVSICYTGAHNCIYQVRLLSEQISINNVQHDYMDAVCCVCVSVCGGGGGGGGGGGRGLI